MSDRSRTIFNDPVLIMIIIAILVKRLGNTVNISQRDIEDVSYNTLEENKNSDGSLTLSFKTKTKMDT